MSWGHGAWGMGLGDRGPGTGDRETGGPGDWNSPMPSATADTHAFPGSGRSVSVTSMKSYGTLALTVLCFFAPVAGAQRAGGGGAGVSIAGMGHDLGKSSAKVFIVEFADFGCSYCAKFNGDQYPKINSAYIEKGTVRWKMVPFVTGMFRNSREVAEASECAAVQGSFWKMHDLLYLKQKEWKASSDIATLLSKYAAEVKLDRNDFTRCLKDPNIKLRIDRNTAIAQQLGIRGTPTFYVNGRVIPGAIPYDLFQQVIAEAMLK